MHKRKLSEAMQFFNDALDSDFGVKVATNDAAELQKQFGVARVHLRKQGITDYDLLSFRKYRLKDEPREYVFITKRLSVEEIQKLTSGRATGDQDGETETEC